MIYLPANRRKRGNMELYHWYLNEKKRNKKFTAKNFAMLLGISKSYLSLIMNWKSCAKYKTLLKIQQLTGGEVKAIEILNVFEKIRKENGYEQKKRGPKPKEN